MSSMSPATLVRRLCGTESGEERGRSSCVSVSTTDGALLFVLQRIWAQDDGIGSSPKVHGIGITILIN